MSEPKEDQLALVFQYIGVVFREAYRHRYVFAIAFAIVSLSLVGLGLIAPKTYTSSATVYADRANIIQPLLSGQTSVTNVEDEVRVVKETIYSPSVMNKVVRMANVLRGNESPAQIEEITNKLSSEVKVGGLGGGYIKISFSSSEPDKTFNVLKSIIEVFIKESSEAKRAESRQAYEFINNQVESYKQQLQNAEQRLRKFKANSIDGTEEAVNERIAQLRNTVETLNLDIEGVRTKINGMEAELGKESQFVAQQHKISIYRNSLAQAEQQMATLLLSYTDTHPDVVSLRYQIEDIKKAILNASNEEKASSDVTINPLYEVLRADLSSSKVQLQTLLTRLSSTEKLLGEEYDRLKRVADNQAQLSELTRDSNVTRGIYEDMLERKEKARLSMTLDIEGRGLNFKVQEPPAYPLNPTGLRFVHFLFASPILGALLPLGVIFGLVLVDPRIRFGSSLMKFDGVPLLAEIGHTTSSLRFRLLKKDVFVIGFIFLTVVAGYVFAISYKLIATS